jgi:diguanylate cyclase (GGDEF)-like protein
VKILLVSDSKLARHPIAACLHELGLEFTLAENGTEVCDLLQATDAMTLVFLDWASLGSHGIELCRRIENLESNQASVYTVVLTAKDRTQDLSAALEAGADDYLLGPLDSSELKARILVGKRALDFRKLLGFSATHDFLTKLMNRTAILVSLERELARSQREGKPSGVIIADLDCSRLLNDTLGRPAVDAVLAELARRLTSELRPYDLAGRSGGEEFLLLLPDCDLQTTTRRAEQIRRLASRGPFDTPAGTVSATVSMGVTVTNCDPKATIEAILHSAEAALSRAKESGRNRVEAFSQAAASAGRF